MKKIYLIILFIIFDLFLVQSHADNNKTVYKIGILANRGKPAVMQKWRYTAKYLTDHITDKEFVIIPLDFDEIESFVQKGRIDFLISDPYFFVTLKQTGLVQKILTLKDFFQYNHSSSSLFGSVIFFKKDRSDINSIEDLKNKNFVAVNPKSIGGWLAASYLMFQHNIDPYMDLKSLSYVGSEDDVVLAGIYGVADAGCIRTGVLENMYYNGIINLLDISYIPNNTIKYPNYLSTELYSEWLLMKTTKVSTEMADQITKVLLTMETDTLAAVSGEYDGWTIAVDYTKTEDIMKTLQVGPFVNYGRISINEVFKQYHDWIIAIFLLLTLLIIFIIKSQIEIVRRKNTTEELIRNRDKLTAVMNSSNAIISVFNVFGDFTVLFSKIASKIGYVLNQPMAHNIKSYIHPLDAISFIQHLTHVIKTKEEVSSVKYRIRYKDQSWYWQEANISPLQHTDLAVVVSIDISDKIKAEQQIEQQRNQLIKLSTTVEQSPSISVLTDVEGRIEYTNPKFTEITGYTLKEVKGKKTNILRSSETQISLYKNLWKTIIAGKSWKGIFKNKKKDSTFYWEEAIISPIKNEIGITTNFIKVAEDITEKRKAEQETKEALKIKSDFISMVTHEIRTPLTAITEGINLFFELPDYKLSTQQEHLLKIVRKNVDRFGQLVNDVLDFQKLDAGRMNFVFEDVQINGIINDSIEGIRPIVNEKKLELLIDLQPNLPIIKGDANRLIQVLTNILHNAVKFTATGTIHIISCIKDDNISVSIKDSGIGIPENDVKRIFHRFEQAKNIHAKYKGTGLGLAISLEIMNAHNGKIDVKSIEGEGTTFCLMFPISKKKEGQNE